MKRLTFIGAIVFMGGIFLFGMIHLATANYIPSMSGWSGPPGKFQQVRNEIGANTPYILSIFFVIIGLLLLFHKEVKAIFSFLKEDNEA
ncbi:hypothetical protein [Pontibacillus yanchengensis]|uniref:Uncharacterized protein n=1 Tax=Pontibacillus yanchengensis Y32 TaxID=1385514 RepID=A0A0A2TFC8_9BACI|nr:hypothetical protein [Pontibacillus yanchengensis]KGP74547.1 hypothetical protein N782_00190 [Pontibacillus yanchengensis Y32]